jgi:phenylacetate-CoA ligase
MFTSGSTGRPLEFRHSAMADVAGLAQQERLYETHGVDRSATLGWIRHVDAKEGFVERRRKSWNLADPAAEVCEVSKALSTAELADWLRRERPSALMAAPSMVDGLIAELEPGEVALSHVLVTSEPAREELAEAVAETFAAKLVDSYGTREVGAIATTCPDAGPAKHVEAATILIEILRPDGMPAEPGESGRVVATPLYAYATPFIRYDLGDTAVQGAQVCACGRGLPLIEHVLGRSHALFRFADGTTRFPVGLKRVGRFVPLVQMQAVQTHLDRVEVRYVPKASGQTPDFEGAAAHLKNVLHPDLRIDFVAVEAIAPGPGGKHEDLISRVA